MLTNTAIAETQDPTQITAVMVAIEDAERRHRRALADIAQLLRDGAISAAEAAELEADTLSRFVGEAHDVERHGAELYEPAAWARYERRARQRTDAIAADRLRSPRLRGLTTPVRARREREMCVVASARVSDLCDWQRLLADEDPDALSARHDLAAAGLL